MHRIVAPSLALLALPFIALAKPQVAFTRVYPNYPLHVFEAQGTVIGDATTGLHLMVAGGFKGFPGVSEQVWTRPLVLKKAEWVRRADMPVALTHMAQVAAGPVFYGAGGYLNSHPGASTHLVYSYDLRTDKWTRLPNIPGDRAGGGMVLRRRNGFNELIFAGGVDRKYRSLKVHIDHSETWALNLNNLTGGWVNQNASIPDPRNHMAAVDSCGKFYWVGGQHKVNEKSGNRITVNRWLPRSREWTKNPPAQLPYGLGHVSASVLPYKCGLIVIGGMRQGVVTSNNVLHYDLKTNKWSLIGKYPHDAPTPICGLKGKLIMCATGGEWHLSNRVFIGVVTDK